MKKKERERDSIIIQCLLNALHCSGFPVVKKRLPKRLCEADMFDFPYPSSTLHAALCPKADLYGLRSPALKPMTSEGVS